MAQRKAGRHVQAVGEDGSFVGAAIAVGVGEDQQFVVRLLGWLELRIDRRHQHPQPASRIPGHADRVRHTICLVGIQVGLIALDQRERFKLGCDGVIRFRLGDR